MQICSESDCFQFMDRSRCLIIFQSNSVVFYYNPMLLFFVSWELFFHINLLIRATIPFLYPQPLHLQRKQSRRKQLFEIPVSSLHLEQ